MIALAVLLLAAVPVGPSEGRDHPAPHGGILAPARAGHLELVVGPSRLALYPLDAALAPTPIAGSRAQLIANRSPGTLPLSAVGDHWEAENPFGIDAPLALVAVVQDSAGAVAARFAFAPGQGSTYHDHRPLHGGLVGMAGERHLELALARGTGSAELQLYLTDAYRQPISLAGVRAALTLSTPGGASTYPLTDDGDCLVAKLAAARTPLDVHAHVVYPGDPTPVDMDFYLDDSVASARSGAPITIRVGGSGFSPSRIEGRPGEPLTLRFLRTSAQTCATRVVFPTLGLARDLPLNEPVDVSFVPGSGETHFACGMGMFKGDVVVR